MLLQNQNIIFVLPFDRTIFTTELINFLSIIRTQNNVICLFSIEPASLYKGFLSINFCKNYLFFKKIFSDKAKLGEFFIPFSYIPFNRFVLAHELNNFFIWRYFDYKFFKFKESVRPIVWFFVNQKNINQVANYRPGKFREKLTILDRRFNQRDETLYNNKTLSIINMMDVILMTEKKQYFQIKKVNPQTYLVKRTNDIVPLKSIFKKILNEKNSIS